MLTERVLAPTAAPVERLALFSEDGDAGRCFLCGPVSQSQEPAGLLSEPQKKNQPSPVMAEGVFLVSESRF